MQKLIECVPNFSEGCDLDIIRQITAAIESVEGVSLLDVDPVTLRRALRASLN
jgi:glutamate formiminotransferase/formiminotetrahydrofolate cyclodeaminase